MLKLPLILLPLALLLSACSVVEFAYNNAPSYLQGRIESAFELDEDQRERLSPELSAFFQWHRRNELPIYAGTLAGLADELADGMDQNDFNSLLKAMEGARRRSAEQALERMAGLLTLIRPEQLIYYEEAFQDRLEDDKELMEMDVSERLRERAEKNLGRLEDWFGELDADQAEFVIARFMRLPDFHAQWIAQRVRRHEAFMALMRTKPDETTLKARLRGWFVNRSEGIPADYEAGRQAYWRAYGEALADINTVLSNEQREQAMSKLREYAQAFERLSRE